MNDDTVSEPPGRDNVVPLHPGPATLAELLPDLGGFQVFHDLARRAQVLELLVWGLDGKARLEVLDADAHIGPVLEAASALRDDLDRLCAGVRPAYGPEAT